MAHGSEFVDHLPVRTANCTGRSREAHAEYAAQKIDYIGRGTDGGHVDRDTDEATYFHSGVPGVVTVGEARSYVYADMLHERTNARIFERIIARLPREFSEAQAKEAMILFGERLSEGLVPWFGGLHMSGKDAQNPHVHVLLRDRLFASDREARVVAGLKVVKGQKVLFWPSMRPTKDQPGSTAIIRSEWQYAVNLIAKRDGLDYRMNLTGRAKRIAEATGEPKQRPDFFAQKRAAFRKRSDETKTYLEKTEARIFAGAKYSRLSSAEKLAQYTAKVKARRAKDDEFEAWWEERESWTTAQRRAEAKAVAREKHERIAIAVERPASRSRRAPRYPSAQSTRQPGF